MEDGMADAVTVRAFAKVNLGLRVRGIRPDGYHELQTVFQTVAIADTLTFRPGGRAFRLRCTRDDVPADERNLVWRAAAALWTALGRTSTLPPVAVAIRKMIPPRAGLGGGSADAAATLLALARLWNVRLPVDAFERIAADLGADVPFFLCGGLALGLGRGDEIYPLAGAPPVHVVVAYPAFGVSTSEAFAWYDADSAVRTGAAGLGNVHGCPSVWRPDPARVVNDLESSVLRRHPEIGGALRRLRAAGATAAALSGSGSAVFGLFPDALRAKQAARRLDGRSWTARTTRTLTREQVAARFVVSGTTRTRASREV
jgi:4-diphosphocytidyl-2-C-methyl-D-erythritol kinase